MAHPERTGRQFPGIVATDQFTRLGQRALGSIEPWAFPRLRDYLAAEAGEIHFDIQGDAKLRHGQSERRLQCIISGWLTLQCHSTLQLIRHDLAIRRQFVLVESENALPPIEREPDDEDYIVAGSELDLTELVEDEVILNLPMVPRSSTSSAGNLQQESDATSYEPSPFAMLAALKKPNS